MIKDHLSRLPARPGVYRMYGSDETVLYVGKAKSLKARVANYTRLGGHTQRIAAMISLTARMEFVVTETETEALLAAVGLQDPRRYQVAAHSGVITARKPAS